MKKAFKFGLLLIVTFFIQSYLNLTLNDIKEGFIFITMLGLMLLLYYAMYLRCIDILKWMIKIDK